jgi:hypothetical protein
MSRKKGCVITGVRPHAPVFAKPSQGCVDCTKKPLKKLSDSFMVPASCGLGIMILDYYLSFETRSIARDVDVFSPYLARGNAGLSFGAGPKPKVGPGYKAGFTGFRIFSV